jgi:hypothetical protein
MQSGYKEEFQKLAAVADWRVEFRDASLPGYELETDLVFGIDSCKITTRQELGCERKTSCVI